MILFIGARFIGTKTPESYQRVIIAKDLTHEQRKERRGKIKNKKRQNERQQPTSTMDARAVTPPTKQFIYREPVAVGMPIHSNLLSPISEGNAIQHTQLDQLTDSQIEILMGANDNTTITNISEIEETFMGGLSQPVAAGHSSASTGTTL